MIITLKQLVTVMPIGAGRASLFVDALNAALNEFEISTPIRIAAFLAQIAVESGELRYTRELGDAKYLDKYDTGTLATRLGNTPEDDDDGQLYRGRGLIQITGRTNYFACGQALRLDLLAHPELLEAPIDASRSAAWFWREHGLNVLADLDSFGTITRRINGGFTALDERLRYWLRARKALDI